MIHRDDHHMDIAKNDLQTCKAHFTSIMCGAYNPCQLHLWCWPLQQSEHTRSQMCYDCHTDTNGLWLTINGDNTTAIWNFEAYLHLGSKRHGLHIQPAKTKYWQRMKQYNRYICYTVFLDNFEIVSSKYKCTMPSITLADALICMTNNLTE